MGCFNDLPIDVKWLVFREMIKTILQHDYDEYEMKRWEFGFSFSNPFEPTRGSVCNCLSDLAAIDRKTLKLVKSKCFRTNRWRGWWFVAGALTM